TMYGGTGGNGTLFRLQTDGTFTKLHDFDFYGFDGYQPSAALVVGPDGALYGSTIYGGTLGGTLTSYGTLFRVQTNGTFTKLHEFQYYKSAWPMAGLVVGADGAV